MSNLKDLRFSVCSYKVKPNSLSNLRIKVKISKVTSHFQIQDNTNALNYSEEYEFKWQEKIFSPNERLKYSSPINNPTLLEEKYMREITENQKGFPTKRLFSYVEHDEFIHTEKVLTTKNESTKSYVANILETSKYPQMIVSDNWKSGIKMNPIKEPIDDDENYISRFLPNPNCRHMFIMADLNYPVNIRNVDQNDQSDSNEVANQNWIPEEVILCRISIDDRGTLIMQPDFSKIDQSYIVENSVTNENFEYSIINASDQINRTDKEKEEKLLKEIYARSVNRILSLVGSNFDEQVQDGGLRLFVTGEIYCAYNFEHQNIYVQYFVDVPEDWNITDLNQLTGITQISKGKIIKDGYLNYFSFPLEFNMHYKKDVYKEEEYDLPPKWPVMYIEVFSVDSWSRFRTEGYGYTQLPSTPGMHKLDVSCWRPLSDSITNELRRFFVGGSAELEDITFAAIPATFDGRLLSKYGFRTMSTGNVVIKLNCLHQSSVFLDQKLNRGDAQSIVNRIGGSNIHFGVMEVIKRFHTAKNKLIKVRQAYIEDERLLHSAVV